MTALIMIAFIMLHSITLFVLIVPLSLGRYLFRILYLPQYLIHDPLCFVTGSYLLITMVVGLYKLIYQSNLISHHLRRNHPFYLSLKYLYHFGRVTSFSAYGTGKFRVSF